MLPSGRECPLSAAQGCTPIDRGDEGLAGRPKGCHLLMGKLPTPNRLDFFVSSWPLWGRHLSPLSPAFPSHSGFWCLRSWVDCLCTLSLRVPQPHPGPSSCHSLHGGPPNTVRGEVQAWVLPGPLPLSEGGRGCTQVAPPPGLVLLLQPSVTNPTLCFGAPHSLSPHPSPDPGRTGQSPGPSATQRHCPQACLSCGTGPVSSLG